MCPFLEPAEHVVWHLRAPCVAAPLRESSLGTWFLEGLPPSVLLEFLQQG